ncbi:MAG: family 20 glycosylhydrolase [Ignavibacteria bacterium]|nr:family 20 glycosylhydrolase [Ignavibacteria bacterium]
MGDGKPYGGFYTQEEVRAVVEYATQRGITVVPEIELPGHSVAALTAYPELSCTGGPFKVRTTWGVSEDVYCAGNEKTFAFLEDVLGEVMELFPSQFIHIGGDECPKARWKACPKCRQRITAEKLKNEEELQSWFIRRIERFVNSKGRRIIGWDEILEGGLAPNAAVMSWRGIDGGIAAAKAKHDVVMSPTSHCYFDYAQGRAGEPTKAGGFIPLERVYGYEPVPDVLNAEEAKHILGAQGNVWTEWMPDSRIVEYMALPRMAALAEVVWSPREGKSFTDFTRRMEQVYERLTLLGVNFRVPSPDGLAQRMIVYGDTAIALRSQIRNAVIRYETGGADPTAASPEYTAPIRFTGDGTLAARLFLPDGRMSPVSRGSILRIERGKNGVVTKYFEGRFEKLPNMKTLKPLKSVVVDDLDHLLVRQRAEYYAISFTGHIALPADGEYTFTTVTDDGSIFFIDGKQLINDDGLHSRHERSASGRFTKGRHPFELRYLQAGGDSAMEVWISGPGIPKQLLPPRMLYPAAGK